MRRKLESGSGCARDLLNYHLLPNVICTSVIETRAKTVNDAKKYVGLTRNEDDEMFVDETSRIVVRDIVGTNGVLHVVDEVIVPPSARSVGEALEESGNSIFK